MRNRGLSASAARSLAMANARRSGGRPKRRKKERKSAQPSPTAPWKARLRNNRRRISAMGISEPPRRRAVGGSQAILGTGEDRADEALQPETFLVDAVPQPLVERALVGLEPHLPPEVPDEVRLDHGADEPLGVLGARREGLHSPPPVGIGIHQAPVGVVDLLPIPVLLQELALVV